MHAVSEGHTLIRGFPPFPLLVGGTPPLSTEICAQGAHADQKGCPPFVLLVFPPPLPFLHTLRWERTLLGGCPTVALLFQGSPLFPLLHGVHKVNTLQFGGSSPPPPPLSAL